MSAFDQLARPIQKWIRGQGWKELRKFQSDAVHAVMDASNDLIIAAATAGGKTEAAFLPLISQVLESDVAKAGGFDLVYIGPLKALINDQTRRLEGICDSIDLPVVPWHGDIPANIKERARRNPRGLLLITPESLESLFVRRGMEIQRLFGGTNAVVIDELHTLLDSERGIQLRSLLTRLELATGHGIRRVGLSATLGDMELTKAYLRPEDASAVKLIKAEHSGAELRLQLRGYVSGGDGDDGATTRQIAGHLFEKLRGSNNLVFAGNRQQVEIYADRLRVMSESAHLPQEFFPHHASLSKGHREFVEDKLKSGNPTTAVCTSTLELGIDIGDVTCVAQIGAPFSVAALRQRLGRSGRRAGQPAILRQYVIEAGLSSNSSIADRLRLGLVRTVSMTELLLEGWCEPPKPHSLHLSTLVHQILSIIAERGGASAQRLFVSLCQRGPFRTVDQTIFLALLRNLGSHDVALIEQAPDGMLLLGEKGEKLVEHYSFYAVFSTPEEYRLVCDGKEIGTIPVDNILVPGTLLIFSGRRWQVIELHETEKIILVKPAEAGIPPKFGGDPGDIHDCIIQRMFMLYVDDNIPVYLDKTAVELLTEARAQFEHLGFERTSVVETGEGISWIATRQGSVGNLTLMLALQSAGFKVQLHDGFLEVDGRKSELPLLQALQNFAEGEAVTVDWDNANLMFEKFHPYLSTQLLELDACSSRIEIERLPQIANAILANL
ncbi:MAG: ATP-dependent helicase [Ahrensia sp.]|nr:ATP-dependent helicase [Ahrensia sp.]|tara:strand:+ start:19725 stop:21893 length:2169 start_codon:yes stop_codon:yes gene_type:complete